MSSNPSQNSTPSKAINIPNQSGSTTYNSVSSIDIGSQRRAGGSGSFGAGLTSRNTNTPRNNQSRKSQHKRQRRPGLLDDEEYSESAIMRSTNSRKGQTSITHLMNFSLPPRPQYQPPPRNIRRYASWGLGSGHHAMDKARYVHANYRFIVTSNRAYHAQAANADVHLDWESVLQVLVSAQTQSASCPICLSTPVAPRMARCGHIFCLPCLIRYMHSSDEDSLLPEKKPRWKKCPICWDTIYIIETRPVRWFRGQEGDLPFEGGDVVLRLVKREPRSTLALPRDGAESIGPDEDIPWYHAAEVADYARIMKAGEDYMVGQYDSEIEDLRRQEAEDEVLFGDETTWTQKAIAVINDAKAKVKGIGNPPDISQQPTAINIPKGPILDQSQHGLKSGQVPSAEAVQPDTGPDVATSMSGLHSETDRVTEALNRVNIDAVPVAKAKQRDPGTGRVSVSSEQTRETNGPHPSDHPFYFYQALPHFYLSPLDIRILKTAFGDYSSFPATILPRVEHISTGHIVDGELRKRVKYLGHLPQGCEVSFLECDWRDVVGPEILERFAAETARRRKRNREKEAREEKDRVRAEKEDEKHWAAARRNRRSSIGVTDPLFFDHDFQPLTSGASGSGPPNFGSSTSPPEFSHPGAANSSSSSPPGARTVWGTAAVPTLAQQPDLPLGAASQDGWLEGWEEELLAQQEHEFLAQAATNENTPSSSSGGKKKKNKKITLMSTNIQRGA
ncbi:putative RING finger domain protein (Rnf10) [Aspergillus nomiae NRRL 13137]|uniref:Putative RING finger domain protein (Rnf10) n=1 Tax=Aspergillus nomiae NRRL (strain ATCC 15546 / NRRL 13137 / CBS 260.88 / M93) TaxID=1509407 RepID=A0A0L1J8H2_ASPN3|nr:putative RING finger domain protein (Rnf10) [Aspergillus nomiae NRRL 13137]KNG87718.1 putative RING finger domain protein (Rnf10) [Aspergillus nomiae NRRL 13137]